MKLILTLFLWSILLLGCGDSKENKFVNNKEILASTTMDARTVAQKYQITNAVAGNIKCFISLSEKHNAEKSESIHLKKGQHVFLATGTNATILVNDVHWLHVIPNDLKQQSCYVQTLYLAPVADYSPNM